MLWGTGGFPEEKSDDYGLTGKLFEQNSNLAEDTEFQIQVTFEYLWRAEGCKCCF